MVEVIPTLTGNIATLTGIVNITIHQPSRSTGTKNKSSTATVITIIWSANNSKNRHGFQGSMIRYEYQIRLRLRHNSNNTTYQINRTNISVMCSLRNVAIGSRNMIGYTDVLRCSLCRISYSLLYAYENTLQIKIKSA